MKLDNKIADPPHARHQILNSKKLDNKWKTQHRDLNTPWQPKEGSQPSHSKGESPKGGRDTCTQVHGPKREIWHPQEHVWKIMKTPLCKSTCPTTLGRHLTS
jgi:hypothetical protein